MNGFRRMRVARVVTTVLVAGAILLGLPASSARAAGSARPASDKSRDSGSGSAVEELDDVVRRLEAAADEVVAPLDQADEVFERLEGLIASVGEGARGEVIRIVVSVVNTGDAEVSVEVAHREEVDVGAGATGAAHAALDADMDAEGLGGASDALAVEPSERAEGSAAVPGAEPSTHTGDADGQATKPADTETLGRAKQVGHELRTLLSSLAATPARAKQLGVVAKDTLVALPKLGAQAVASAQLKANNPLAGAAARAEGQADLARIQEMVRRVRSRIAEIQKQVLSLPSRAAAFGARAQQILAGAVLTPPPGGTEVAALANLEIPAAEPPGESMRSVAVQKRPYQWGWLAISGVSGVAAAVGGVVLFHAQRELMFCHEPSSRGCANYQQLHNERTAGLIFLSAGAAVMTTTFIGGFVANKTRNPRDVGARLSCGAGLGAVQCEGAF